MKLKRTTSILISFLILISMLISGSINVDATTASKVSYSLDNSSITIGQTFNIYVNCEKVNDLYGASVDFKYDKSMFQILDITEGNMFKNSGKPYNTVVKTPMPNTTGIVSVGLSLKGNISGFNGTGQVFVIKAKALKTGTVNLKTTNNFSQLGTSGINMCVKLADSSVRKISVNTYQVLSFNINSTTPTVKPISVSYQGHVPEIGWQSWVKDGALAGTEGKGLRVEGIRIKLENAPAGLKIKYKAHVENIGWQAWVYNGATSGTEGKALRIEALQMMLEGTDADKYRIEYQSHVQNQGWQPWVNDGQISGTSGKELRIEAIKIKIIRIPTVSYQCHVAEIGWQSWVKDGALAGTEGKGLGVEAFRINLENAPAGLRLKYKAYVDKIGWQGWVYNGATSGTEGKVLRIEALQMMLEGTDSDKYRIEYQSHVQNEGWQPWVNGGQISGTSGKSLRIEAIKVRLVKK